MKKEIKICIRDPHAIFDLDPKITIPRIGERVYVGTEEAKRRLGDYHYVHVRVTDIHHAIYKGFQRIEIQAELIQ